MNINLNLNPFNKEYTTTPQVLNEEGVLSITADLGSTGTRTTVFEVAPQFKMTEVLELSSEYSIVEQEVSHFQSKSKSLKDLLEIELTDVTTDKPNNLKIFPTVTKILKGGVMKDCGSTIETVVSDVGKAEQRSTFVNAIVNIGLQLFIQQATTRERHSTYNVDLTLALTTEDTQNITRIQSFKDKLAGEYIFTLPRLGYDVKIKINKDSIYIEDESLAVLRYWVTYNSELADKYNSVLVVDGGGRSFDIGYLEEGRLVNSGCKTLPFGGNRLIQETMKDIVNTTVKGGNPSEVSVRKAMGTGLLQRGASHQDVSKSIVEAKKKLSKDVMKGFNEIFQTNRDMTPESVALVLTAGGCFRETGVKGEEGYVNSLTDYLSKEYSMTSEHTVFARIDEPNPISKGLVFYRVSQ